MSEASCRWFKWIGQPLSSCDGCGRPAWEHAGHEQLVKGAGPIGPRVDWEQVPWEPGQAEEIRRRYEGS